MNDLINKRVFHDRFKEGVIVDADEKRVVVDFEGVTRIFPLPDAFTEQYLRIMDSDEKEDRHVLPIDNASTVNKDTNHYRKLYRNEFRNWIINDYNKNSGNVVNDFNGYASDVFFIEKNCPEREFLDWFRSEETLEDARNALLKVPGVINGKQDPEQRVSGYITRMRLFKAFLQQKGII